MTREANVLLVDDDPDICATYAEALTESGYSVAVAHDGHEALRVLFDGEFLPKLILLDLMMPLMDGREFHERLRKAPVAQRVPVVVMTANRASEGVEADAFLRKPMPLAALLATVARFCER
jgi:two-component system response regulator PrrA